jgi:hypothetical protein
MARTNTSRASKLYNDSPGLARNEESGKVGITKPSEQTADADLGDGEPMSIHQMHHANERREMKHRHVAEHLAMHHRHEMEHVHHEGHKGSLHDKHEAEMEEMHGRHEKEVEAMHSRHEKAEPKSEQKK